MRRRHTYISYFTVLLLTLTLTLSLAHVPVATSQNSEEIISKLKELQEEVSMLSLDEAFENTNASSGRRKALINKLNATIHQIKAGAYKGAINKLENDMKHAIVAWITEEYEPGLIEKVNEIIRLIKGELCPPHSPEASFVFTPETPLAGTIVTFNASSSEDPDGTIVSYTWDFGDSTVITVSDPITTHIYGTYGIYTVNLTVTDDDGLTDTKHELIKVIAPPAASFTYSPLAPLVNEDITFNASSSTANGGKIKEYSWNLGDGFTKTGESVTHAYSTEGIYSVVLNVTDTEGLWDTSTTDITVHAHPEVDYPPEILGVFRVPEEPNYDEHVRVLASVIDSEGEVESVILGYSVNSIDWTNQTMAFEQDIGFYSVYVPPQPYNTTVNYKVYASDNRGNWSVSRTYNYTVVDKYSPIVEIEEPMEGSYVRGLVNITVSVLEDNLVEAKLAISGTVVSSWQDGGKHVFTWNTSSPSYPDGAYIIELGASDKSGSSAKKAVTVTVDNTVPTATINAPSEGAFLRGTITIEITGEDVNLDRMELKLNGLVIKTWLTGGKHVYFWETRTYSEGTYGITLTVHDKAENRGENSITTVVDNVPPRIEAPTWKPEEPTIEEHVNITVEVSDTQPGSGIQNVTLWYKNTTMVDYQLILMNLNVTSGKWTATIPAQSTETTIEFYIEAFDKAGNKDVSDEIYDYNVIAPGSVPTGVPLAWMIAIILLILLILAATASAIYFGRRQKREKLSVGGSRAKNYKLTILLCL